VGGGVHVRRWCSRSPTEVERIRTP
jgi:hypothetical protein